MTLQPLPSEFSYIWGKFSFLFYQCNISCLVGLLYCMGLRGSTGPLSYCIWLGYWCGTVDWRAKVVVNRDYITTKMSKRFEVFVSAPRKLDQMGTAAKSRVLRLTVGKCMYMADTNLLCGVGRGLIDFLIMCIFSLKRDWTKQLI